MPLNETARLKRVTAPHPGRSKGVYDAFDSLPPVFKQRGEDMMAARVAREQAIEALRLVYVAERREQQRRCGGGCA